MKMLNEKEMNFVNGGVGYDFSPSVSERNRERAEKQRQEQEQRQMESIADIRMRAADDALKAAMRIDRQEMEIKEAMRAQHEAFGLD